MTSLKTRFLRVFLFIGLLPAMVGFRFDPAGHNPTSSSRPSGPRSVPAKAINPLLTWNTFLGGRALDEGDDIIVDGNGNIYVTGYSHLSWGNPLRAYTDFADAFVAKLDSSGNLRWNTFLGGSQSDLGYGIALDANGNIYVTGNSTATWGTPIRPHTPGINDAFVAKLDPNGNLLWNTFLGGTGTDEAREIAIGGGNIYVAGRSDEAWGTLTPRAYTADMDAFVANIDSGGTLIWNSFLGGNAFDEAYGIGVDRKGAIYVIGFSSDIFNVPGSWGNPIRPFTNARDAFLGKLNSSGNLTWSTFLGGTGDDVGLNLAVDGNTNIYVTGYSSTTWENPIRGFTANDDAFAAKVGADGNLIWNTFLGGGSLDHAMGIDIDGGGAIYITGYSSESWGNPVRAFTIGNDAFAAGLDRGGNLMWNTFLGGTLQDYGYGIDVDSNGNAYVIGPGNGTWGTPIRPFTADMDAFVVKLEVPPLVVSTSLKPTMKPGPNSFTVTFSENVNNPPGSTMIDDATNPNNYLLVQKGTNGLADTVSCAEGVAADDARVTVTGVRYDPSILTATVTLTSELLAGKYRLFVCGTTSIVDTANNALAGNGLTSGTDYTFDFTVNTKSLTIDSLPDTGFAPNVVTRLPGQPTHKVYSSLGDLWLEIPSLNVKSNIVGIPRSEHDWDVTWLGNEIGWLHGTAFPSWTGNSVLTGHNYNSNGLAGPFLNIKNLKYGDTIIVHIYGEKYLFQVQSTQLANPASTEYALEHLKEHSYLTLITCQGYNPQDNSYTYRRIVRAILVDVKMEDAP